MALIVFCLSPNGLQLSRCRKPCKRYRPRLATVTARFSPKQVKLHLDRGDIGNFLNLPYYNAEDGLRYAIQDDGTSATLEEFSTHYTRRTFRRQSKWMRSPKNQTSPISSLKTDCRAYNIYVKKKYQKGVGTMGYSIWGSTYGKAHPEEWESKILEYNAQYLEPPLPLNEVNIVAKQLEKKDYAYRCTDAPICAHCNKDLCQTRKFGIATAASGAAIANLRKYNSTPPVWFMDINGEPWNSTLRRSYRKRLFRKRVWSNFVSCRGLYRNRIGRAGLAL